MDELIIEQVNRFVLRKQHLTGDSSASDIVQIIDDIVGLHATGIKEPYLALFARNPHFKKAQLDDELCGNRRLVRTRCMRGTLYILNRETLPVAYAATRGLVDKLSRQFAEFRGMTAAGYTALSRAVLSLLRNREMSLPQIKAELDNASNLPVVLGLMCDRLELVRVKSGHDWDTRSYNYAVFSDYYKGTTLDELSESDGVALLVERYLGSFGPATEEDIAWWVGLTRTRIRAALKMIEEKLVRVKINGLEGDFLMLHSSLELVRKAGPINEPAISLLPALDSYLMGYKRRERYLDYGHYHEVFDRGGNVTSTILLDGRIVGVWDYSATPSQVKLFFFEKVSDEALEEIHRKAGEMGRFIAGREVSVKEVDRMTPLTQRNVGGFMSPLRDR